MALQNLRDTWGGRIGGRLAERIPATRMFGLGALVEIVPLVLLPFLSPRKAQADFARDATPEQG
jgi:predicted MFS family arabinose efflux permease